jgi:uncharacterized RDD family membrane protein YckC
MRDPRADGVRVRERIGRAALGPARAVAVARSVVRHRVLERLAAPALEEVAARGADGSGLEEAAERLLRDPALQRLARRAIESELAEKLVDDAVRSPAFKRALGEVLSSAELRAALAQQSAGFGGDLAAFARRRTKSRDASVQARVRRWLRRKPVTPQTERYGGFASRGVGLVVDAALAQLAFLVIWASAALIISLVGHLRDGWELGTLFGAGWLLCVGAYFVGFWSATGQTPGLRMMHLRVADRSGAPPSVLRSAVRLVGLALAIIPLGAGFLPVLVDARRRGLQDFLAGTVVLSEA